MRIAVTGLLLVASSIVIGISTARYAIYNPSDAIALAVATAIASMLAAAAFVLLLAVRGRAAAILMIVGSIVIGGAAMTAPPNLSTDSARYAWDGIVQDAGISPYAHAPVSSALDALRPEWLYPKPITGPGGSLVCAGQRIRTTAESPSGALLCTALNRPTVPTIYPPVAETFFAAVRGAVPVTAGYWPLQLAGLLLSFAVTAMLMLGMRARRIDFRWAALWGWSPFVAAEAVNNSHVDALGTLLILAATFAAAPAVMARVRKRLNVRPLLAGIGIGLATAVKLVPAIAAPPLLRRAPVRTILVAIATFVLVYVPYVLVSGWSVIGYLPGYLSEEGFDSGSRFAVISIFVHGPAATVVAVTLIVMVAAAAWWRTDPDNPWHAQVVLVGTVLLIVSPPFAWYGLVLVPFIALSRRWEWMMVPLALTTCSLFPHLWAIRTAVIVAALVIIGVSLTRWRTTRQTSVASPSRSLEKEPA